MALKFWAPLNNNLDNLGLSPAKLEAVTTASFTDGKIGKSLSGGKIKIPAEYVGDIFNNEHMSICFWYYTNTDATTGNHSICGFSGNGEGDSGAVRSWDFFAYSIPTTFHWSMGTIGGGSKTDALPNNQWTHIAVTFDGSKLLIYFNGVLSYTGNGTSSFTFDTSYYISFGSTLQKINDFRIYDEVLSQKQIKEISKGLVAHYKLEASNINTNLAVFNPLVNSGSSSISFDRTTNTYTMVAPVGDSTWGYGAVIGATNKCIVPYNSYYRFSFEVYVPTEHVLVVDYNNYSNDSSVTSWNGNDNDLASARLANTKTIPANTWTKCVFGSQNAHASNTSHVDIYEQSKIGLRTASDTGPVTWYLRNFKFELDNKATDYVPYGYDPMEFLTTDVSGNGYHIKLAGNLLCNNDSIRYSTSTIFDNVNTNYLYRDTFNWLNSPYTFNCWVYQTSATTTSSGNTGTTLQFIESQGRDCGYAGFSLCSANGYARLYIGTATTGTYYTINDSTINLLNNWHMITGTYDGTIAKLYVDGVLKGTKETSIEPVWTEANGFTIGKMAYGHTNTAAYFPFVGSISDARVYATALTTDDILTLYKTSGIIDNKGNVYAYEFKEE